MHTIKHQINLTKAHVSWFNIQDIVPNYLADLHTGPNPLSEVSDDLFWFVSFIYHSNYAPLHFITCTLLRVIITARYLLLLHW